MNVLKNHWHIISILLFTFLILTIPLGRDQFLDWDECVFSQQAKEMRQTGQFITNHWNGVTLFEKPPLMGWIINIFYSFGINEFTARFGAVLASLGIIFFIYLIGLQFFNKRLAIIAALLSIVAPSYLTYSFRINSDIFFTLFTLIGVYLWLKTLKEEKYSLLSGLFFGLAVMAKGLSIFPFIGVVFLSIFLQYDKKLLIEFFKMLIAFFAVILPWHIWHLVTYPQTFWQVYVVEHLIRRSQQPLDFHNEGRLFYIKLILKNYTGWLLFLLPVSLLTFLSQKSSLTKKSILGFLKIERNYIFIGLLVIIPLIAITQVRTRIWWYVLPLFPYLCLYLAYNLDKALELKPIKHNKAILFAVYTLLIANIAFSVHQEINPLEFTKGISKRNEVFQKAAAYPEKEITYLVWFGERQGYIHVPEQLHTSTTFVFGGNPCAVYYSNKKINYMYDVGAFKEKVTKQKGLFVVENGDWKKIEDLKLKHTILFNNSDFTLFRL